MTPENMQKILLAITNDFESKISSLEKKVDSFSENAPDLGKVLKTIKGKDGKDGRTPEYGTDWKLSESEMAAIVRDAKPIEGVDYYIPRDGKDAIITKELIARIASMVQGKVKDGKNGTNGTNGIDGKDGIDGIDGSPDTPKEIVAKLESLKGDGRLDKKAIKGLDDMATTTEMNRGISILDQRTQFLVNKVASLGTSTGVGMVLNSMLAGDTITAGGTSYWQPGSAQADSTEVGRQYVATNNGTISNLYVRTLTTQNAGGSLVITIRKNSANTAITVTIPAGSAAGTFTDLTNSFTVVAGNLMSIQGVNNAPASASAFMQQVSFNYN